MRLEDLGRVAMLGKHDSARFDGPSQARQRSAGSSKASAVNWSSKHGGDRRRANDDAFPRRASRNIFLASIHKGGYGDLVRALVPQSHPGHGSRRRALSQVGFVILCRGKRNCLSAVASDRSIYDGNMYDCNESTEGTLRRAECSRECTPIWPVANARVSSTRDECTESLHSRIRLLLDYMASLSSRQC
jgi:hypothetical protein